MGNIVLDHDRYDHKMGVPRPMTVSPNNPEFDMLIDLDSPLIVRQPKWMRDTNCRELLRLVRQHSPCSRADLVRYSGLTAPTVSAGIAALHRRGLVEFIGPGRSNGGRPPRMVQFNAKHGYVVGADVGGSNVRLELADLNGSAVGRWCASLGADRTPEVVTDIIAEGTGHLLKQHEVQLKRVLALAVGAPGITDVSAGVVRAAPNLTDWDNVPLRRMCEQKTGLRTIIENDVNLAALGESWCGIAKGARNFIFIAIGSGVGGGIVIDGKLHHGVDWSAGELGYLLVPGVVKQALDVNALGALESEIGGKAIEREWQQRISTRSDLLAPLRATEVFDRALSGDALALEMFTRVAELLSLAIINVSIVLNMSLVVLGGSVGRHPALVDAVRQLLNAHQFSCPKVVVSSLGVDAQLSGTIWLALQSAEANGFKVRQPTGGVRAESTSSITRETDY